MPSHDPLKDFALPDFADFAHSFGAPLPRVWPVGALCRAVADALEVRFNPVSVAGELSGYTRAASGHSYFSVKDAGGQIRCAMFRRAASQLDFTPRDGDQVELQGRLGVYEARGDLQLVVERLRRAGQGTLFEQFLRLKARLEAEGLFDTARKRPLPASPRAIGVVTSLGAAALHDVVTALQRRVPHIPVVIAPAAVQGVNAPAELVQALAALQHAPEPIDVILLVRGGGSIDDLWAFNDEHLARAVAQCTVPVISGVGHETDFTIADFVADLRAPTPTAAAELVAAPRAQRLAALQQLGQRLQSAGQRVLDSHQQRLDMATARLGRPSALVARQQMTLARYEQQLRHAMQVRLERLRAQQTQMAERLPRACAQALQRERQRLSHIELRLQALDPAVVLQRGYAWLADEDGQPLSRVTQLQPGQTVRATLVDGWVDLTVTQRAAR